MIVRREHDDAQLRALARRSGERCAPATRSSSRGSTTTRTSRRGSSSRTTSTSRCASSTSTTTRRSTSTTSSGCSPTARASSPSRSRRTPSARSPTRGEIVELAHEAGALAWADAVHYAPHGADRRRRARRRRPRLLAVQVLRAAPRARLRPRRRSPSSLAPVQGAARVDEPLGTASRPGTLPHELLAGFVAAVDYVDSIGWEAIQAHERALGERFLAGLPDALHALRAADDGRARADVRVHRRRDRAAHGRRAARASATSPSGTGTTTRSR